MRATVLVSWTLFLALIGCGGGGSASVDVGPMPEGGNFTGVWHSPQYGEMHMVQTGTAVVGRYVKDERQGRIQGTVQGNVMRFEWTENREMVAGVPSTTRGRGYFRYTVDDSGTHNILGEWGIDDSETGGGEWNAYKMKNRRPEIEQEGEGGEQTGDDFGAELEGDDTGAGEDTGGAQPAEEESDLGDDDSALEGLDF